MTRRYLPTGSSWTRDAIRATTRLVPIRPSTRLMDMRPGRVGDLLPIRRKAANVGDRRAPAWRRSPVAG
jgi:hypothetical protein